jgi:hypothetical protein
MIMLSQDYIRIMTYYLSGELSLFLEAFVQAKLQLAVAVLAVIWSVALM